METQKKKIALALAKAIWGENADSHSENEITDLLEYPPNPDMGELSFPCFKLSKELRKAPALIAADIKSKLDALNCPLILRTEIVGGYLNFFLCRDVFAGEILQKILTEKDRYGSCELGKDKTVVLDYSSPNVAKPFHIGHLGSTIIGHSLKLIYQFCGYSCIGINHLGDWGTQFGKLIVAYNLWGDKAVIADTGIDELVKLYVRFHDEAKVNPALEDQARAEFTKLENGDKNNHELWKWFIDISLSEYKKTYKQLNIEFDYYLGESFYHDKMPSVIEKMRKANILKIDDGATIVDLEAYGMPPCLILKSDGSTLYPARDISAAIYRKETYNFSKCIYVTDAGQSLHFKQWFKLISLMGYDWEDELIHVPYGKVSIDGAKLATRTGNVILLKDLFKTAVEKVRGIIEEKNPSLENKDDVAEAVGVGAVIFNFLNGTRIRNINFSIDEALSFEGNTGPYAQYTYARICSILSKASTALETVDFSSISVTAEEEFALLKELSLFTEKVKAAAAAYEPSIITRYIFDLATTFNKFYHNCSVLGAKDESTVKNRLLLTEASGYVLASAFRLICMRSPKKI